METLLHRSNWISTKPATTSGRVRVACAYSTTAVGLLRPPRWRGRSRPSPLRAQRSHMLRPPSAPISSSTMANTRRRGPKSTKTKSESGSNRTGSRRARTWNRTKTNSEVNGWKGRFVFRTTCLLMSTLFWIIISTHSIICFSENVPPRWVLACREWFLCFHLLKQGVLWGLASPPSRSHSALLMIDCATAVWPAVERVSRLRRLLLSCWRDCLPWIRSLIWGSWKQVISLDTNVALLHLHWELALFQSALVCVFLPADHEGEKTPVNQLSEEELPDYLM